MKHYKYGGSTAQRTIECPAWHNLYDPGAVVEVSNPGADRGSRLHDVMERIMVENSFPLEPPKFEDILEYEALNPMDALAVRKAYGMVEDIFAQYPVDAYSCEETFEVNDLTGGTGDLIGVNAEKNYAVIIDYKFGALPVTDFTQLRHYAFLWTQAKKCRLALDPLMVVHAFYIQPDCVSIPLVDEFSFQEQYEYASEFEGAYAISEHGETEGHPGTWCEYCPAYPCPAIIEQNKGFGDFVAQQKDAVRLN